MVFPNHYRLFVSPFCRLFFLICGPLLGVLLFPTRAPAQPASEKIHLSAAEAAYFPDALASLAKQGHVLIVAQGIPYTLNLPAPKVPIVDGLSLPEALAKIAQAYDYVPITRRGNQNGQVIVLRKRYTRPDDLPDITAEECCSAAVKILPSFAPFNPNVPLLGSGHGEPLVLELYPSLSPEQKQQMKNKMLPVSSLSPQQQAVVRRGIDYIYIQDVVLESQNELSGFNVFPNGSLFRETETKNHFLALWPDPALKRKNFYFLQKTSTPTMFLPSSFPLGDDFLDVWEKKQKAAAACTNYLTLQKAVEQLNEQARKTPASDMKTVELAPEYQGRRFWVFGDWHSASVRSVAEALTEANELRATIPQAGTMKIGPPRHIVAKAATELGVEIRSLMPAPLLRAAEGNDADPILLAEVTKAPPAPLSEEEKRQSPFVRDYRRRRRARELRLPTYHLAAYQILETLLQKATVAAEAAQKPPPVIGLSTVPTWYKQTVALLFMGDYIYSFCRSSLSSPQPPRVVARFDEMLLGGGPYKDSDGQTKFAIDFCFKDAGGIVSDCGISNIDWK